MALFGIKVNLIEIKKAWVVKIIAVQTLSRLLALPYVQQSKKRKTHVFLILYLKYYIANYCYSMV